MSVEKIIASFPRLSDAERQRLRDNAKAALKGSSKMQADANRVLSALDDFEAAEQRALREAVSNMPRAERVAKAFRKEPPTKTEERLIRVLLDNPGSTSTTLTAEMGWDGLTWQMHFGIMCQKREHLLWAAEKSDRRDANFWSGILADLTKGEDGHWLFTLKPEAVAGFEAIGIRAKSTA